ncbi:hypothetical protein SAMN05216258_102146 [Albimonas pacifica]|uniref:Uncharacterized protein n=1 Tax=Albimonas pacifica TaxID=1114924 RepID=A0A1I3CQI5_9RHOB|nr:hypothetical protein SAMN05216258_102146 [Albimonas pacifica]
MAARPGAEGTGGDAGGGRRPRPVRCGNAPRDAVGPRRMRPGREVPTSADRPGARRRGGRLNPVRATDPRRRRRSPAERRRRAGRDLAAGDGRGCLETDRSGGAARLHPPPARTAEPTPWSRRQRIRLRSWPMPRRDVPRRPPTAPPHDVTPPRAPRPPRDAERSGRLRRPRLASPPRTLGCFDHAECEDDALVFGSADPDQRSGPPPPAGRQAPCPGAGRPRFRQSKDRAASELGSWEAGKPGSPEARKPGSPEARKPGRRKPSRLAIPPLPGQEKGRSPCRRPARTAASRLVRSQGPRSLCFRGIG